MVDTRQETGPRHRDCVMDIETVPRDDLDPVAMAYLTSRKEKDEPMSERMGLYGLTCRIVAISIGDPETGRGRALYLAREGDRAPAMPAGWRVEAFSGSDGERCMLERTWSILGRCERVVTYNGRRFDLPVLAQRSMVLDVPAGRNPSPYRYAFNEACDLGEVITFWGETRMFPLDFVCRALGIESPKKGLSGPAVAQAWAAGRSAEIIEYNVLDVVAEMELFKRVARCLLPVIQTRR